MVMKWIQAFFRHVMKNTQKNKKNIQTEQL